MAGSVAFFPGQAPHDFGPLGRFLPPIPDGIARSWLRELLPASSWVLDPFGVSPRLAVEAARAGYRVLVAANNPIARFLLEMYAEPPTKEELRAALADLAATSKGAERLEPHIRSLYLTECAQCGRQVEAQAFIWERDNPAPSRRIYTCAHCKDQGERAATSADAERAAHFSASGLHRARALERVAPMDDPDRIHVEEALAMYLPRTLYSLFLLVNRLDSFPPKRRRLLEALLLSTFDQTNVLWSLPAARGRPRQLNISPRFLERNVWRVMESAIEAWTGSMIPSPEGETIHSNHSIPLSFWPETPPPESGLCLFEGRLRDLADQIEQRHLGQPMAVSNLQIEGVLTALPRPNQAYWTLSALWSGWLWGHQASAPFKSVLRRRRYDWAWHAVALHAAFYHLARIIKSSTPCLGLIGEAEPGFLSAAILAAEMANLDLEGVAIRSENDQAQVHWRLRTKKRSYKIESSTEKTETDPKHPAVEISRQAAMEHLHQRGEPTSYIRIHTAILSALVQSHCLMSFSLENPAELIHIVDEVLQETLSYRGHFSRYGGSSRSLEVGYWWLDKPAERNTSAEIAIPLADRVEMETVQILQKNPGCRLEEIDQKLCTLFTGLLTPNQRLVEECVRSYGEQGPPESNRWQLRPQDNPQTRLIDLESMKELIAQIGKRLGFQIEKERKKESRSQLDWEYILWKESDGRIAYTYHVLASAVLGEVVYATDLPFSIPADNETEQPSHNILVIPGGRSNLVEYKQRYDPRLRNIVEANWRFVKFRHLRWLAESKVLDRVSLDEQLNRDPPSTRDPQLPLL